MNPDLETLLEAVRLAPADVDLRLVLADALEESGREPEAGWVRADVGWVLTKDRTGMSDPLLWNRMHRLPRPQGVPSLRRSRP